MQDEIFLMIAVILLAFTSVLGGLVLGMRRKIKEKDKDIAKEKAETTRRLYEISILKEIGERTGYSLNVEEILEMITGSLRQFIDYTAVSYIVIYPEKIKLNTHFEQSVDRGFQEDMKGRMLASLGALLEREIDKSSIEEVVSGAIFVDELPGKVESFFNIPLVISDKVAGLLTIAHTSPGLYKEEDMTILYKIVSQASLAVSRLQEVVMSEKSKLNAMVESMGDGVLMIDKEYRVIVANPAIKRVLSFKGEKEITIFDFVDLLGGKFDIHGQLEKALSQGEFCVSEKIQIGNSHYEIAVCPVRHHSLRGDHIRFGAIAVFHDVTKDMELERVKEEFTSMIVHELRSPLDGIKKIIELIVSGTIKKSSPKFKEYINMVYSSSASMLELVNDILDYSKLSAGKFEIHEREASLLEVVEDRIMFYNPLALTKKINLSSYVDKSIGEKYFFDDHAVKQVINNFLSNSLKFTSEGGSINVMAFLFDPEVGFSKEAEEKINTMPSGIKTSNVKVKETSLVVAVFDSGMGIKSENVNEPFSTYKQLDGGFYSESKGTGLGLAIAKGIIESHGGSVGLTSIEGRGSSFFFAIPAKQ